MKLLIIARHGEDLGGDDDGPLSPTGVEQMRRLAEKLKPLATGMKVQILTSTTIRATESANIVGKAFDVQCEGHELLWSECVHPPDYPAALGLIRRKSEGSDVLILVTHMEYVERLPPLFMTEVLGAIKPPSLYIKKGEAAVIDCELNTVAIMG